MQGLCIRFHAAVKGQASVYTYCPRVRDGGLKADAAASARCTGRSAGQRSMEKIRFGLSTKIFSMSSLVTPFLCSSGTKLSNM